MNVTNIVHSPATAREGRASKSRRTGQILQSMRLIDEAVASTSNSPIGSMPHATVGNISSYRVPNVSTRIKYKSNDLSLLSETTHQINLDMTENLLPPKTPTRYKSIQHSDLSFSDNPRLAATASLFSDFKDCLVKYGASSEVFRLIESYEEICYDHEQLLTKVMSQVGSQKENDVVQDMIQILTHEKQTWRLVNALYRDRMIPEDEEMTVDADNGYLSELRAVEKYFKENSDIRQAQIVIDWLEQNASDEITNVIDDLQHYSGRICWENSLHDLKKISDHGFSAGESFISEMDPDAPVRTRRSLHNLDREDETRLLKCIFAFIRAGKINEAEDACTIYGQPWRIAVLEGWRLHHDSNMVNASPDGGLAAVEGNAMRDMWKVAAWACSNNMAYDVKERAIYGSLCGNLKAMLEVSISWEDFLWSHYKAMVDIATEQLIQRSPNIRKSWQHMHPLSLPEEYFMQKCDLNNLKEIFDKISCSTNQEVADEAARPLSFIQRCIILNDTDALVDEVLTWLNEDTVHPHLLRFINHLLLLLQGFGTTLDPEKCARIMETYVKQLINDERTGHLVAVYSASLPPDMQLDCYTSFLEGITDTDQRKKYIDLAEEAGLDVAAITKNVVERIRASGTPDVVTLSSESVSEDPILEPALTPDDVRKIGAIEWLVFDSSQRGEALKQSNALIRSFLASRKHNAARQVLEKIPKDSIDVIHKEFYALADKTVQLPPDIENAEKEHLCMKAFLTAQTAFSDWFKHFHNKPTPIEPSSNEHSFYTNSNISNLVAEEQRQKSHADLMNKWKETLERLCNDARDKIYNVLLFPNGGWLVDCHKDECDDDDISRRRHQMELLRQLYIPSLCDLLLNVLFSTGERNDQCARLADVIAAEDNKLYKVFSKEDGQKLLQRIQDAMIDMA